jgi:DNA-binding IclR family transcriptional regulator
VPKPLTPLEDATLRFILSSLAEADGWLDLTRICSRTGRHLGDVRQAVARLVRRRLIDVDERAGTSERWLRFAAPGSASEPSPDPTRGTPVA